MRYTTVRSLGKLVISTLLIGCVPSDNVTGPDRPTAPGAVPIAGPMSINAAPAGALSAPVPITRSLSELSPTSPTFPGRAAADDFAIAPTVWMVWQNTSTGDRSIWTMEGTQWGGSYVQLPQVPPVWSIAATGDFNADNHADIVWQNTSTGDRSIWFMTGNTWGGSYALLPQVPVQWSIAGVGDFNNDNKPDLVWQNTATGDRSIWLMNGAGIDSYALLPRVPIQWDIAAVGDFNDDGKPDLVWQNTATGERSIWFMDGAVWGGTYALLQTVPSAWRIAAAADFDGDADLDLVWQNISTGERSVWLMVGAVWQGSYASLPTVPTQWEIAGMLRLPPAPIANAGGDQDKNRNEAVTLTAAGSSAPAGATYTWTQVSGSDVTGGAGTFSGVSPTFTAPASVSTLAFHLTISAYGVTSEEDLVVILVLEDKTQALFVAPGGNDANAGTRAAPLRTINAAINKAATAGQGADVYVQANGTVGYTESVALQPGTSLYGGYSSGWIRAIALYTTRIRPGPGTFNTVGVRGLTGLANATVDGFSIETPDATSASTSNYGVLLIAPSAGVVISNNVITAGRGANGFGSGAGANYLPASRGQDGATHPSGAGGAGGSGGFAGGRGGNGGAAGFPTASNGQAGSTGGGTFSEGGAGGVGSSGVGQTGSTGADGASGFNGAGGADFGQVTSGSGYVTASGQNGGSGGSGSGGAGGGGGGGSGNFFLTDVGSGGGGGGGGGLGGGAGGGGAGGGASFGILILNAIVPVTITNNTVTAGNGGNGGNGSSGGFGGLGGAGGSGGPATSGGAGGDGGRGGAGGRGGNGGGGAGGPSIALVEWGGVAATKSANALAIGVGGSGGFASPPATNGARGRAVALLRGP